MKSLALTLLLLLAVCSVALAEEEAPGPRSIDQTGAGEESLPAYELANGHWYAGTDFEAKTMYAVGGVLLTERPADLDSVVDLGGGFVVPPFGEAHTHRPGNPERTANSATIFLEAGVFYVMNQGNLARYRD